MQFEIGKGFSIENGIASGELEDLTDKQIKDACVELNTIRVNRGLWLPEQASQLVVADEVLVIPEIDIDQVRTDLFGSVKEGSKLYSDTVKAINSGRRRNNKLKVLPIEAYKNLAEEWLEDDSVVDAATVLPRTEDRPLLVIPQLTGPVSHEEIVDSWTHATNGKIWPWYDRMNFLNNWTSDQLSGYSPENEGVPTFAVVPTAYDIERGGTVVEQVENLDSLRENSNAIIRPVSIFGGAVLAHRYTGEPTGNWKDTCVRSIELKRHMVGGGRFVPGAFVVFDGVAFVYDSRVGDADASRLQVESRV